MKKYLLLVSVLVIALSSCKKYDVVKQNTIDDGKIQEYLKANNITATKDESGLYYQIITPGETTPHPAGNSVVTISYTGSRLDNGIFDSSPNIALPLSGVIQGWQIGVPKIGKGGHIKLFVPSSLAYGNEKAGILEKNTVLIFDINLFSFTN